MSPRPGDFVHDIRIPLDFSDEPRFLRLTRLANKGCILHVLSLWAWVASHFPSIGRLEDISAEDILIICRCCADQADFVEVLLSCSYLAKDPEGVFYVPNWRTEQPFAAQAEERSMAARLKAAKRWGVRGFSEEAKEQCHGITAALQSECSNTNSNTNLKSPPTPPRGGREGNAPVNEIASIYADVLPELPQLEEPTEKMRRDIEARWKAGPERQDLEWWRGYFAKVRECPFLMGESGTWRASLGWLVNRGCMDKVLGGEYPTRAEMDEKHEGPGVVRAMSDEEFERMRADEAAAATASG